MVYVAKEYRVTVAGKRRKQVCCEKCGCNFAYDLSRAAQATASAPYFIGQNAAKQNAALAAADHLESNLDNEVDLVACPECNWVNQDLVERYRLQLYRGAPLWIALVILLSFLLDWAIYGFLASAHRYTRAAVETTTLVWGILFVVGIPVVILLGRELLRRNVDPNKDYPRPPRLPVGTPPAIPIGKTSRTGATPALRPPQQAEGGPLTGWAVFRPGQIYFPPICCICLAEASTVYRPIFEVRPFSLKMKVPLCGPCALRIVVKWTLIALGVFLAAIFVASALPAVFPKHDLVDRWLLFVMSAFFLTAFGAAVVPNQFCRPYQLKILDGRRGVAAMKTHNSGFTELLIEQIRESDRQA